MTATKFEEETQCSTIQEAINKLVKIRDDCGGRTSYHCGCGKIEKALELLNSPTFCVFTSEARR